MTLDQWCQRWNVPHAAIQELAHCAVHVGAAVLGDASEANVQSRVRLEAARKGVHLFRNNVGAGKLSTGNFLRWGLGNDSANLNAILKSADLIGIRKRLIVDRDVGTVIGQFVSRECKRENWHADNSDEFKAQLRWHTLISSMGGDSAFVQSEGSL